MELILFGAPGVGKGTQAKLISQRYSIPHISTGDILRNAIKNGTELGQKAKEIVDRGDLVPDDIMVKIIEERFSSPDSANGFILDGFPRTVEQAKLLSGILKNYNKTDVHLVILDADDEIIVKRLSSRRTCSSCLSILTINDIQVENQCPVCGKTNTLYKRKDDEESVIKNRLSVYHKNTAPVVEYYRGKRDIIEVDGSLPVEEVNRIITERLKS